MSVAARGVLAMVAACVIWGLSTMFYKALDHIPALVVLAHRTIWSFVFFFLVLAVQRRLAALRSVFANRAQLGIIVLAAMMVSVNWGLFIWAIQVGRAVEASLGYFIFPLVSVLLGLVFFGEALSRLKLVAVALASLAVAVLTFGLGAAPYISIVLALTFGVYSVVKKRAEIGPVVSVTAEVLLLLPIAGLWLWSVQAQGSAAFGVTTLDTIMLIFAGPLTGFPLVLFAYASRRINLATVGLVHYINPSLQFLVATLVFVEPFTRWHSIAFPLIWAALAIYSFEALRQERRSRRSAISSGTSATTLK